MRPAVMLQYALPHRFLSRLVLWATRWRLAPWKDFLIRRVVRSYHVDLREAVESDPSAYPHFNAFFTRSLKPDARPAAAGADAILCPADGRISQSGEIRSGRLLQAKGRSFTAAELLGDAGRAAAYDGGTFLTVYLSPRDYHRVHMPMGGRLVETVHVPGRLFSVAPFAVRAIPRLFARNERLVCHFEGANGPFCVVLVGALLVSGVETVWRGVEIPPYAASITRRDYWAGDIRLERGAEMGRFNMGSTVIVLVPAQVGRIDAGLAGDQAVQVRSLVGRLKLGQNVTGVGKL